MLLKSEVTVVRLIQSFSLLQLIASFLHYASQRRLVFLRYVLMTSMGITLLAGCRPWLVESTTMGEIMPSIDGVSVITEAASFATACGDYSTDQKTQRDSAATTCIPWWSVFNDPQLIQWIEIGLQNSYRLEAADARLRQVMAELNQRRKLRKPVIDVSGSVAEERSRQTVSSALDGTQSASLESDGSRFNTILSASYEVDIWGRVGSQRQIAFQQVLISQSQRLGIQQTVVGEIIKAWYGLAKDSHKLTVLERQLQRTRDALTVIQRRYDLGQGKLSDIWQQQQLVNRVLGDQITTAASKEEFKRQLQRWTGVSELDLPSNQKLADYWLTLVIDPVLVLDSKQSAVLSRLNKSDSKIDADILLSRPDLQEAWSKVRLTDAQLAKAISERFPKLSISASYSSQATTFDALFDNWLTNLAANIALPIIDSGQRKSVVEQARQTRQAAIADYQQAWLEAVIEVEQALAQRQQFRELTVNTTDSLRLAQQSETFISRRYANGVTDFLSLLRAQQDALNLESQRLETRWSLLQSVIQLYKRQGQFIALPSP